MEREPWDSAEWVPVLEMASLGQKRWRRMSIQDRIGVISGVIHALDQNKHELATMAGQEMGKPISQALSEIDKCVRMCQFYSQHAGNYLASRTIKDADLKGFVQYHPLGVVLGIMPWNFPYWQTLRFAIPALLAGNAVLIKPAPQMLRSANLLEGFVKEAIPIPGIYSNFFIEPQSIEEILGSGLISGVSLTGSEKAGRSIAALSGAQLIPSVLELGGSDPLIVLPDADLHRAAKTAVLSRMTNNGQTCIAAKRWLVHNAVTEEFLALCQQELHGLKIGPPESFGSFFTCLAREDLAQTIVCQVQDALDNGAESTDIPRRKPSFSTHLAPRILTKIDRNMRVWKEEVFGPVGVLLEFTEWEEALELANDSSYGLGASIWTKNIPLAQNFAASLDVGTVAINGLVRSDPRLPFGGVKRSGFGRELSQEGLYAFCNIKSLILDA